MVTMKRKELDKILRRHQHWLKHDCKDWDTMMADLSKVDLSETVLRETDLRWAKLSDVDLSNADLRGADLSNADLSEADLRWADLSGAKLSGAKLFDADLTGAKLSNADLSGANMSGADLSEAELSGANLHGVDMEYADIYTASFGKKDEIRKGIILTKPMTGYKKTLEGVVITAEIPAGAIVFSINRKKCRTNMATIRDTAGHKLLHSQHDPEFTYKIGKKIIIPNFDIRYNVECSTGFHFFRTKNEAAEY